MSDAISKPTVVTRLTTEWEPPATGTWVWVKEPDDKLKWLGCITQIGSNYIKVEGISSEHDGGVYTRVHFDHIDRDCTPEPNAAAYITGKIEKHRLLSLKLMERVKELTAGLSITVKALPEGSDETQALAVRTGEPMKDYKKALIKAEKTDLPDLFKKIKDQNQIMGRWMKANLLPLEARVEELEPLLKAVKSRIFNVELYAGLVEEIKQIQDGEPAQSETKVHLFQRRCYMDEECLAEYRAGGMDISSIEKFDQWLTRPENLSRLLPYPRCIVSFQVRRKTKEREAFSMSDFIRVMEMSKADKLTFLYLRNGERVYRLSTEIEFGNTLFPDIDKTPVDEGRLFARVWSSGTVEDVVTEHQYLGAKEERRKIKKEDRWHARDLIRSLDQYEPVTPGNVYFDDVIAHLQEKIDKHNRIVLVLQGLLDRAPVFHPHPEWKIWTAEGFEAAFELIFDYDRALSSGQKIDFEEYRRRLNSTLKTGSVTVGQEDYWEEAEAKIENARQAGDWRTRSDQRSHYERYSPYGDPGPGTLAKAVSVSPKGCTYRWTRERKRYTRWTGDGRLPRVVRVPLNRVLNVDAYTPGDFKLFFNDPRTREEYLKWAPLLLEAEEYHAGNRALGEKVERR